jgi:hypothetical protein
MPLAFHITETMTGLHHFVDPALGDAEERPCWFRITWGSALSTTARLALARKPLLHAFSGVVRVDGLTEGEAPCEGTLSLDYVKGKITYDLSFRARGAPYTMQAEKVDVDLSRPVSLVKTHTTAYSAVRDREGRVISRGVLHFRPESMGQFVRSLRLGSVPSGDLPRGAVPA